MKNLLLIFALLLLTLKTNADNTLSITDDGEIRGKIFDKETGQTMPFASVAIVLDDKIITGVVSDANGNYSLKSISPGSYTVRASYIGYRETSVTQVLISENKITLLDIKLSSNNNLPPIEIVYSPSVVNIGEMSTMAIISSETIENSPAIAIKDIVATVPGVAQMEDGGSLYFRGSREDGTLYIVDGVRTSEGIRLPRNSIAQISVITGGIPAQFGDVTGGIVIITTKSFVGK